MKDTQPISPWGTVVKINLLKKIDIPIIVSAFAKSGWQAKSQELLEYYLKEQNSEKRTCFIAFIDEQFVGYVNLKWQSSYAYFAKDSIPEISDLNVLPEFRKRGIGAALIGKCEEYAASRSDIVGIGVGLYPDYGSAQRLYIKRGYIPDGQGATYNYEHVIPGKEYPLDDELVLWFTKKIQ